MAGLGLSIAITGDVKGLKSALGEAESGISVFGKSVSVKGVAAVAGLAGAAGIAVAAITDMTMAAAADRDEQAKLLKTIEAATGSTADYTTQVEAAIAAGQEMAFTDSETRAALEPLVRSTGDVALATSQLALAQDLARASGTDLATAAEAVAKANQGQDKGLKTLLPGLEMGATATETLANAQKAAAGQAKAFAESTEGQLAKSGDAFGELTETIGEVFLPILDEVLPALLPLLKAFGELIKALLPVLIPLIKALATVIGAVAKILVDVVKGIVDFIKNIGKAIDAIREFLSKVPLIGGAIGGAQQSFGQIEQQATAGTRSTRATPSSAPASVTVNITGDPIAIEREVVRALRGYSRRQGTTIQGITTTSFGRHLASVPGI